MTQISLLTAGIRTVLADTLSDQQNNTALNSHYAFRAVARLGDFAYLSRSPPVTVGVKTGYGLSEEHQTDVLTGAKL